MIIIPFTTYLFTSFPKPLPLTPFDMESVGVVVFMPLSSANLFCFSWHSRTDVSSSLSRERNQSTVKLSTVNVFACNFLSESSISVSSNLNTTGVVGEVLCFSVNSRYSSAGLTCCTQASMRFCISRNLSEVRSPHCAASWSRFRLLIEITYLLKIDF